MDVWQLLKSVNAPEGGEIIRVRDEYEPDGSVNVAILVDYGKDGTKKFIVPIPTDEVVVMLPEVELPDGEDDPVELEAEVSLDDPGDPEIEADQEAPPVKAKKQK